MKVAFPTHSVSSLHAGCTLHPLPYFQRKYPCNPYTHTVRYTPYHIVNANTHVIPSHMPYATPFTILSKQIPMSSLHTCRTLHSLPYCQRKYLCHPYTQDVCYILYHIVNANTHVIPVHMPYATPFTILSTQIHMSSLHTCCTLHPLPYCQRKYPCNQAVRYTPYHIVTAYTNVIPTHRLYTTPLTILSTQIPMSSLYTCCTLHTLPYCQRKYPCHPYTHIVRYTFTILSTQIPMSYIHTCRTLHPLPYCQSKYPCHPYTHAVHYTLYHNVNANTHVFRTHRPYTTPFTILSQQIPMSSLHTCCTLYPLPYCQRQYPCHPYTQAVRYTPYHIVNATTHVIPTQMLYTTPLTILSTQIPMSSLHTCCTLYHLPYCQRKYPCHTYSHAVQYTLYHIVNANTHVIPTKIPYTTPFTILSTQIPMYLVHTGRTLHPLPYCHSNYPCHTYTHAIRYTPYHIVNANTHVIPKLRLYATTLTILSRQIPISSLHTGCTLHPLPYCQRNYPCHPYTQAVHYTPYHIVNANTHVIPTHRLYATPLTILSTQLPM